MFPNGILYDWVKITFDDFDGTKEDGNDRDRKSVV